MHTVRCRYRRYFRHILSYRQVYYLYESDFEKHRSVSGNFIYGDGCACGGGYGFGNDCQHRAGFNQGYGGGFGSNVVHNAKIKVQGQTFYTDNNGLSPSVQLSSLTNSYDGNITNWYTVNVVVEKEGFVPAVLFNCVVYSGSTRKLTVRLYASDSSDLPFVSYVESPPDDFVQQLIKQK